FSAQASCPPLAPRADPTRRPDPDGRGFMATSKTETTAAAAEEERLGHALVSRGLLTAEEFRQCRAAGGGGGGGRLAPARPPRPAPRGPGRRGEGGADAPPQPADPRLRAAGTARPGVDGDRLQGPPAEHEPPRRGQDPRPAHGRQPRVPAALPARGP